MKKLLSCLTAAVMLTSALSLPAAADDPADVVSEALSLQDRIADGLSVFEQELDHVNHVKYVNAEETLHRFNQYLEFYTNTYLNITNPAAAALTHLILDQAEYAVDIDEIKRKYVHDNVVEIVKGVMPPEEFERMTEDPDAYTLYYMNGTIIIVTNTFHSSVILYDNLTVLYHIIKLDPISVAWDLNALSATTVTERLYDVIFLMNERNRELAQIEYEMTKMGLWNVNDEEITIPYYFTDDPDAEPADEDVAKLPLMIYDLTSGSDTYRVLDQDDPVFGIIAEHGEGQTGDDTLAFDYELDPADLEFLRINQDLFINDPVHEVYLMISEYFSNPAKRVETIRFSDGTEMTYSDVCDITNQLVGTEDDDDLAGYVETNYIWGKDGNDTITLGGGDDFIWGGKGDDLIQSGGGSDIIYYELGDGNDIVDDTNGKGVHPCGGHDVIWLGEGILPDEVKVSFADGTYEFVLTIMKTGETIRLPGNQYSGVCPVFPIEEIHFTDGTTWDRIAMLEKTRTLLGTNQDDTLQVVIDGDAEFIGDYNGSATLRGYAGNDTLLGGGGNDMIYGGKGDDTVRGFGGDDTIFYELGDGNDLIDMGNGSSSYPQGGYNVLVLGEGILPEEVTVERSADDYSYTLWINKTGESIMMTGNVVSGVAKLFPIKEIRFADETVWKLDYLETNFVKWIRGTDGDDSINDSGDSDIVFCGKGNDYIRGKTGDDLFIYEEGDGRDTIQDSSIWGNGFNTLQFGAGVTIDDLYSESSVYNGYGMTRFYIKNRSSYVQFEGINEIKFDDGTTLPLAEALEAIKPATELTTELDGDLNCDGILSSDDLRILKDYLTGTAALTYPEPADLNDDEVLDARDFTMLKAAILKQEA